MDWWDVLERQGWPTLLLAGAAVFAWRLWVRFSPKLNVVFDSVIAFLQKGIESNEANTKANEMHAIATATQTPLVKETSEGVRHLVAETDHDDGRLSNVMTHQRLAEAIQNQRLLATAAHEALDTLAESYPEWHAKFQPAIDALQQIERGRA